MRCSRSCAGSSTRSRLPRCLPLAAVAAMAMAVEGGGADVFRKGRVRRV